MTPFLKQSVRPGRQSDRFIVKFALSILLLPPLAALSLSPAQAGISNGYVPPASKEGITDPYDSGWDGTAAPTLAARAAKLKTLAGIGVQNYNVFWSGLEGPAQLSSDSPLTCPGGYVMVPASEQERVAKGYHRFRCFVGPEIEKWDRVFLANQNAGIQTAAVLWQAPSTYRYPGCPGFVWLGGSSQDGCVPRDDAMNDWEDYVNFLASRYNGANGHGKIYHYEIWNENQSGSWFDYRPQTPALPSSDSPEWANIDSILATARNLWLNKYADLMSRANTAITRHTSGVRLYASLDLFWHKNPDPGVNADVPGDPAYDPAHPHPYVNSNIMDGQRLVDGLWDRLGTSIDWSIAIHPFGDDPGLDKGLDSDTIDSFLATSIIATHQKNKLTALGVPNPGAAPQAQLYASQQGAQYAPYPETGTGPGTPFQGEWLCKAHNAAMQVPELFLVSNYTFDDHDAGNANYALLPAAAIGNDLANVGSYPPWKAYVASNPALWNQVNDHYCCTTYGLPAGCAGKEKNIRGYIDGVTQSAGVTSLNGWSCAAGYSPPIEVHLYAGGPAGGGGDFVIDKLANMESSDPAIAAACGSGTVHKFSIPLDQYIAGNAGRPIYIHGLSPYGLQNNTISQSGALNFPAAPAPPAIAWTTGSGAGAYDVGSPVNPASVASGQGYGIRVQGSAASGLMNTVNIKKDGVPFAYVGGGDGFQFIANNPASDTGPATITYTAWATDSFGTSSDIITKTVTVSAPSDTTAPVLSGVGSSNVTHNSAVIAWTTNEASDSQVEYGLSTAYGTTTNLDPGMVTSHSAGLSGLSTGTLYHYRVKSRDAAANLGTSADYTFTTSAAPDTTAPVISGVGSSNISNTAATISWTTNEASDSQIEYGLSTAYGTLTTPDTNLVTSHGAGLSGLAASTLYHYRVKSKDAATNLGTSADYTFNTSAAPDITAPVITGVGSSNISHTAATISWTTNEGADSQVEYGLSTAYGASTNLDTNMVTSHSSGLSGLAASTVYHYRVRSKDPAANSAASADHTFTTSAALDVTAPVISGVGSSNISNTAAVISWTTNEASDSQVEYGLSTAYGASTGLDTNLVTGHGAGLSGLAASTVYHYRVKSKDAATNLGTSADYTFTTSAAPDTTPPVISGVGSSNITHNSAGIAWTTNEASDSQVEYGLSTAYGTLTTLNSGMVTSHTANLSGLAAGTLYHYRARSADTAANLGTSADHTFTTSASPDVTAPVISGVGSSGITDTAATISWTTNEASDSQVEYGLTASYTNSTTLNASMLTSHSAALAGLTGSTTYHYRVRSRDASLNGAASTDHTFTSSAAPDTTAPVITGIGSSQITHNSAALAWTTNEASDSQVEYATDLSFGNSTSLNASLVTSHSAGLSGLAAGTLYYYRVKSRDAALNLGVSGNYSFTTAAAPDVSAPVISGVGSSNITNAAATLSWSTDEASSSQVEYGLTAAYGNSTTLNASLVTSHSAGLSGLAGSTLYHYRVKSKDAALNAAASGDYTFTTSAAQDLTPPAITGVGSAQVTYSSATITWTTNEASDSQVEYGLTPSYGALTTLNTYMVTSHSAGLAGLAAGTLYHYRVRSRDAALNQGASGDHTFTTYTVPTNTNPSIGIDSPWNGETLTGTANVTASAWDDAGVSKVEFSMDGRTYTDNTAPYSHQLNTLKFANGWHQLTVKAYDINSNTAETVIDLRVLNQDRTDTIVTTMGGLIATSIADITVPPMSLAAPVTITVANESMDDADLLAERSNKAALQNITPLASGFRLLPDGYVPAGPVKIKLPLNHSVTVASTMEEIIGLYSWNGTAWQLLTSTYTASDDTLNAETSVFSVYRLLSRVPVVRAPAVGAIYVFPNPAKNGAKPVFHIETDSADKVEISVHDFTGRLIFKKLIEGGPALINRNNRLTYAYEYEWDAKNAASGAYFYVIVVNKGGGKTLRKGKFAIIR